MTGRVVILKSAETDLKELRLYIVRNFGQECWQTTFKKIKESVKLIRTYPDSGSIPPRAGKTSARPIPPSQFWHEPHRI